MESVAATLRTARAALAEAEAVLEARVAEEEGGERVTSGVTESVVDTAVSKAVSVVEAVPVPALPTDTAAVAAVPSDTSSAVADTAAGAKGAAVDTVAAPAPVRKVEAPPAPPKPPAPPRPPRLYSVSVPEIDMVFVKGGKFTMGCQLESGDCINDERPRHEVKVGSYYIGKYPVTQKQWASVMGINPAHFEGDGWESLPIEQVSWNEAQEFIKRLNAMTGKNYRLPTEAEWEYAALGGLSAKGEKFSGHRFLDDIAWYDYNSDGRTHPIGSKQPNELGLYDMSGNVWEWVNDRYDKNYYRDCPLNNPKGPKYGVERVYRGGSFNTEERYFRVSLRNYAKPEYRTIYMGFRLAGSP